MKTIKLVFQEFLNEQQARLKPRTYRGYEEAIYLFEDCLDGYGWNSLSPKDADLYDELYDEGKEFCDSTFQVFPRPSPVYKLPLR
ncbi:MAG: hypothetical protein NUK54_10585, partial [Methanothrix sp.]|nr:hypothetical protein [Methanothrix sp.]